MRVKYFYNWGYFYPLSCGADLVAVNHLQYFQARGWEVDCILAHDPRKSAAEAEFRAEYSWLRSLTVGRLPPLRWRFGDLLQAFAALAEVPAVRAALAEPADLFVTNYVFTAPLACHVPAGCRCVLETLDIMSEQFALNEIPPGGEADGLHRHRTEYLLKTELELYRLFDAAIMINRDEAERVRRLGAENVFYVPRWCPVAAAPEPPPPPTYDLLFVASNNPINQAGIDWFYRNVYVRYLWQHGVRLAVAGDVCKTLRYADTNVTLLGRVEGSLEPVYAASSLVVAPIFEGTGLSIKTVEALAMGKAVVAAPAAARGLDAGSGAFLALDMKADPEAVARAILRLLADPRERRGYEAAARAYATREFRREAFFHAMDRAFQTAGVSTTVPLSLPA